MSLADPAATTRTPAPRPIRLGRGDKALTLHWSDGRRSRFHYIWLRDHCRCPACLHPDTRERTFSLIDGPESPRPLSAEITAAGALSLLWPSGANDSEPHHSLFPADWLAAHDYSLRDGGARDPETAVETWGAEIATALPRLAYRAVMESDAGLARWIALLFRHGFAITDEGPLAEGSVQRLAKRVGPLRWTNFGTTFDVVALPKPNNSAYTALGLDPHGDLPNYQSPPDYQLLYCLANEAEGGESILVDGRRAIERLRVERPEAYRLLSTLPITFRFADDDWEITCRAPVIDLDRAGQLRAIRFNNWIRAELDLPPAKVEPFYRAYRAFWRLLRDPALQLRFRLKPGQCLTFDNKRVLHARAAFTPTGRRHLQGCYLDREVLASRLALLRRGGADRPA